jgi:hypothetical protein
MIFRLLSIVCIIASSQQQSENDHMCKTNGGILCVKEQLTIIATIAKGIARKSIEIETDVSIISAQGEKIKDLNPCMFPD